MGSSLSVQVNAPQVVNHFSAIFAGDDRLRLTWAPFEIINATKNLLQTAWGLQNTIEQKNFVEFKLKGTPFYPFLRTDNKFKHFMCTLMKEYYSLGWHFKVSSNLKLIGSSTDVVIFEKNDKIHTNMMCISLHSSDKIIVIASKKVIELVRNTIMKTWHLGIQKEEEVANGWQFKLKGAPWGSWLVEFYLF